MNDFLKKFTNDNYGDLLDSKENIKKSETKKEKNESLNSTESLPNDVTQKNAQDIYDIEHKRSKIKEQLNSQSKTLKNRRKRADTIENISVDSNYQKKKIIQHGLLLLTVLLLIISAFFGYKLINERKLPNFIDKSLLEVQEWSQSSGVVLEVNREFSMEYAKDNIISVNKKAGSKIQKGDLLKLKVSDGANPEELIKFPDFSNYDETSIQRWINKNCATNLKIKKEYNVAVEKNKFIRLEFTDKDTDYNNYKRKDYGTIYISKGEEKKEIELPDFSGKEIAEASKWAEKKEVKLSIIEEYSSTIGIGKIISQSIVAGEKIGKGDEVVISLSKGKARLVPDFSKYNLITINETGAKEGVSFLIVERYNATIPYAEFISQDIPAGTILDDDALENVIVTFSLGKPYINRSDIIGKSEKDIRDFFYSLNQKGSNITYILRQIDPNSCQFKDQIIEKGRVCGATYNNQFIEIDSQITLDIANADLIPKE